MDNTTSTTPSTKPAAPTVTPFPVGASPTSAGTSNDAGNATSTDASKTRDVEPVVDKLLDRATQGVHDTVDSVAAKVSSAVDGVQGGVAKAGDTRDEWIASARDAIREHPFAAIAAALLVGAAALSLLSSHDR